MRMTPNRFSFPEKPVVVKRKRAKLVHLSPPLKGLAEDAKSQTSDAKFAGILVNLYVEDDRLVCRAGHKRIATMAGGQSVDHLIPYYGAPNKILAATNNTFCDAETGAVLKSGFLTNDWHWTAHSDLGATERVVMVNGADGVWSWDGATFPGSAPITITKIGKATTPATNAVITVTSLTGLKDNDAVVIVGADVNHAAANGPQRITNVGKVANTFELIGVNSSGWGTDQTTGTMTVTEQGSFALEAVKPPTGNTWLNVNQMAIVVAHQNRLFFADETNLAVYYLPIQQRYGELKVLPLNALFKRGGRIIAMNTWTVDGGMGMDDQLVIFSSNGEAVIYSGVDPATDFSLVGVFRFEAPMSKWSTLNYGGELYCLIPTGLTPMSTVLKSGRDGVEAADKNVVSMFMRSANAYRDNPGWELYINPHTGRVMCNIPQGGGIFTQLVRGMAKPVWSEFRDVPARCWAWMAPYNYFGDIHGNVYQMSPSTQYDQHIVSGALAKLPIKTDVLMAWSQFKTPAIKHFKMVLPYVVTDGFPKPKVEVMVDFDLKSPINVPSVTPPDSDDATWDLATWDAPNGYPELPGLPFPPALPDAQPPTPAVGAISGDYWAGGSRNWANWTGVGAIGRVGAVRMTTEVYNCSFAILGWDVLYDEGSVFG